MTSADTVSSVTKTASFLVVPASRREWASTKAPAWESDKTRISGSNWMYLAERTWKICVAEQKLLKHNC